MIVLYSNLTNWSQKIASICLYMSLIDDGVKEKVLPIMIFNQFLFFIPHSSFIRKMKQNIFHLSYSNPTLLSTIVQTMKNIVTS